MKPPVRRDRIVPLSDVTHGLADDPRWTVTCLAGHTTRERAPQRPKVCPTCGGPLEEERVGQWLGVKSLVNKGKKRPSGQGALFTKGDGR